VPTVPLGTVALKWIQSKPTPRSWILETREGTVGCLALPSRIGGRKW
jgi:hypothetical protein